MGAISTKTKVLDRYFNGKSPKEISITLDVSQQIVYKYINEFRCQLIETKQAEVKFKLDQCKAIEKELFRVIKLKKPKEYIDSLTYAYVHFLVN